MLRLRRWTLASHREIPRQRNARLSTIRDSLQETHQKDPSICDTSVTAAEDNEQRGGRAPHHAGSMAVKHGCEAWL